MRTRAAQLAGIVAALAIVVSPAAASRARTHKRPSAQNRPLQKPEPPLPCGDYLGFQILLDRQGFSPGQIDDHPGPNFSHAIAAFQTARKLPASGVADCDTWHALAGDNSGELIASYTIAAADVEGPFEKRIPPDLIDQARLPSLDYQSPLERLAEKFHASPALLKQLNPRLELTPGATLQVPATTPFDASAKPVAQQAPADLTIAVTKRDSALRAIGADGTVIFFAPVTTGSQYDPLPIGDWKVSGVQWRPAFHYNPKLFWDADPKDTKATIKPGPNNPVGVVWIALDLPHYGLHGTPEPGHVGHSESHGCVRLTNWDAARVASLVRPGTPVQFR